MKMNGTELAEKLADFVNTLGGTDHKAFVEKITTGTHRTLQQQIMELFLECCEGWVAQRKAGFFDARNEFTVKLAEEILKIDMLKGFTKLPFI